ncbi:MAG: threonylcarbamoyl-AMP synthase [Clostridiales Family XIII bacterium]|jgi:L-threonylcarbamoyladenylate synthase|nr:threonylcarbamoyl-AMP synthase [Clostridiales Family XIII bacterium]
METKILDVREMTEETLRRAQALCEPEAMAAVDAAMEKIREAAAVLRQGGLVAFPTETVYGLGADAFNADAAARIYEAKGRPSDNPMIVHIARASDLSRLTTKLTPDIVRLADEYWPGPLTMILSKREEIPARTTGGLSTVGVRLPDSPVAIELIRLAGMPVAAPSANLSGSPSPTKAEHVIADLSGRVDVILAGPDSSIGIESTVVDMTVDPPQVLRPGVITADDLSQTLGRPVAADIAPASESAAPRAPGMKYRHYAPKAEMIVIEGSQTLVRAEISRLKLLNEQIGRHVGIMLFEERAYTEAAHDFYSMLRDMDESGVDLILAGALAADDGLGFAVMNRMMKAAGYQIVRV